MSVKSFPDFVGAEDARAVGGAHEVELRAFRLLNVVGQELRWLTDDLLREDGLTTQQAALLTIVKAKERPALAEVASALTTSHQNVKQIALALERKGFLRIVRDEADARVRRLVATAKNDRYWKARDPVDSAAIARWFAPLSPKERGALVKVLVKLEGSLRSEIAEAKAARR